MNETKMRNHVLTNMHPQSQRVASLVTACCLAQLRFHIPESVVMRNNISALQTQ